MLNKIAKYNHNWILVLAMSLAVLFILMALLLEIKTPISRVNAFDGIPILVLLAFGSVIAPILEELSFRGFFTENRKLKLIALIGFLSYTTMSFCSKYSIVVAVVNGLVFLLAIALFRQFKSNAFCVLFCGIQCIRFRSDSLHCGRFCQRELSVCSGTNHFGFTLHMDYH